MGNPKCSTPYCRGTARTGRRRCNTCQTRICRKNNPVRYAYDTLKANARRRGKPFTITFEQFWEFCYEYPYMAGKGRSGVSFGIDCIIAEKGYVPGNLQLLSNRENSRKGKRVLMYDWETKYARYV
jgi:hypothetical protein